MITIIVNALIPDNWLSCSCTLDCRPSDLRRDFFVLLSDDDYPHRWRLAPISCSPSKTNYLCDKLRKNLWYSICMRYITLKLCHFVSGLFFNPRTLIKSRWAEYILILIIKYLITTGLINLVGRHG